VSDLWPFPHARGLATALALLAASSLTPSVPLAQEAGKSVMMTDYNVLKQELDAIIDFETLPRRPEPGIALEAAMREGHAWLGERLAGQQVLGGPHDRLLGTPLAPMAIAPGARGANLSVAWHRGFGSNALFPLGPAGFPARAARGEGSVAILFDHGQRALGLRIHSDYAAPLGDAPAPGTLTIAFYRRDGARIGQIRRQLDTGITELGVRRADGVADIAAITVTNDDPGGIALDDILYQTAPMAF
jgi:hypothetical protein